MSDQRRSSKLQIFGLIIGVLMSGRAIAQYNQVTVPLRYMAWPAERLGHDPDSAFSRFGADHVVPLFYSDTSELGMIEGRLAFLLPYAEYQQLLEREPEPLSASDMPIVQRLIGELVATDPGKTPDATDLLRVRILGQILGPTRLGYLMLAISHRLPLAMLYYVAGVVRPTVADASSLSFRRFGVVRRRGPRQDARKLEASLEPLVPDRYAHMIVSDQVTPFVKDVVPAPAQFYPGFRMSEFFSPSDPSLSIPWGHDSKAMHALLIRALMAEVTRGGGRRPGITPEVVESVRRNAETTRLDRLYFFLIENFRNEEIAETMALIDGGTAITDRYELPVEARFNRINFRELFPGEVSEVHGLGLDPDIESKLGERLLGIDTMAIILGAHIRDSGLENVTFLLHADTEFSKVYTRYGFARVPGEQNPSGGLTAMFASGANIVERVARLHPNAARALLPELPNHLNRRVANLATDQTCRTALRLHIIAPGL